MELDSTVLLHGQELWNTLLASQHLFKKATESIVPHFTNKKTEAQSKKKKKKSLVKVSLHLEPGGPEIYYVVQAELEPDPPSCLCLYRVLRL